MRPQAVLSGFQNFNSLLKSAFASTANFESTGRMRGGPIKQVLKQGGDNNGKQSSSEPVQN